MVITLGETQLNGGAVSYEGADTCLGRRLVCLPIPNPENNGGYLSARNGCTP